MESGLGINPNDVILTAAAMTKGGRIHTLNVKHYLMKDVAVVEVW